MKQTVKIFTCEKKLSNGRWSPEPEKIAAIATDADEEFPSLSTDGQTLYFSSKGLGGMGGYDIYKSVWDDNLQVWGKPVNMGSPVNSPYDDLFYLE
ncbi:MAG: PD40 domain-containing protein [Sphingobacteriaceae bacterium]|nr:PD40 domain-containing protein [Sphingobacteriaceae bacterium]